MASNRRISLDKDASQRGAKTAPLRTPDSRAASRVGPQLDAGSSASAGGTSTLLGSPSAKSTSAAETLTVIARFRAPKANAKNVPSPYVFMDKKVVKVNFDAYESKTYQFDTVFPPTTQQPELFEAVESTIDAVMKGFNATILACKWVHSLLCRRHSRSCHSY